MPIIKSAKKRVRTARKATIRNVRTKRTLKTAIKEFQRSITSGDKKADDAHRKAQSAIDAAAKKNVIHKNKAARKKRQLAKIAKANATGTTKKAHAKKSATSKSATQKAAPKKPAAKKTTKK